MTTRHVTGQRASYRILVIGIDWLVLGLTPLLGGAFSPGGKVPVSFGRDLMLVLNVLSVSPRPPRVRLSDPGTP